MIKKILFVLLAIALLVAMPASAIINVTVNATGPAFIQWNWNTGLNVTSVSVDGWLVYQFDHTSSTFVLSGLDASSTNTIIVNSNNDTGTSTATTQVSLYTELVSTIYTHVWFLLALVCLAYGIARIGIFNLISCFFSVIGLSQNLPANLNVNVAGLPFFIYLFMIIIGLIIYLHGVAE